jgi:hypothetical protein
VVLVGIFGAIGATASRESGTKVETLSTFNSRIDEFTEVLNLDGFERWRNSLELSKVNIGNVNKSAVFNATMKFLQGNIKAPIDWVRIHTRSVANDAT